MKSARFALLAALMLGGASANDSATSLPEPIGRPSVNDLRRWYGCEGFRCRVGNHASCFCRCDAAGMNGHLISIVETGVATVSILGERSDLGARRGLYFNVFQGVDRHAF